jgi:hypothetical protein
LSQQVQVAEQKNTRLARGLVWVAVVCNVVGLVLWLPLASSSAGAMLLMLLLGLVANGAVIAYAISQGLFFELLMEHIWKKVCNGLGGNFVGQGRAQFKPRVAFDPISSFQKGTWERKTIYPKLREVHGSWDSWTGIVYPLYGQCVDTYTQKADHFALGYKVPQVVFDLSEDGLIRIRAGRVHVPSMYGFEE